MPGQVAPLTDERALLLGYLEQQRDLLRTAVHGLTDEQARATPSVSSMCLGGLVKHVARTEQGWIAEMVAGLDTGAGGDGEDYYAEGFRLGDDETLADQLAFLDEVAKQTEEIIGSTPLDQPVPVPQGVPWFPDDVEAWSVRWVLLHCIEETARHVGHADVIRESLDGQTWYPLMADREGLGGWG